MTDLLRHHHDHAVITFDGDVDAPYCRALIDAIETAVEYYGYGVVEIKVESPGGNGRPLKYLLDRIDAYREAGVRFRTSVLTNAASAAAILVALGDERIAAPGASLLFHGSRVYRRGQLSARDCSELGSALARSDDEFVHRLVKRALAGSLTPSEHGAKRADRQVLEGLCLGAPPDPHDTAPARLQTLASALGQTVDEAVAEHDGAALAHLYKRLFEFDRPISPALARTLGLLDQVVAPGRASSGLVASHRPSATPLASPAGEIARETLLRHVLVLGDDNKSVSRLCLAPLIAALARAPEGEVGTVLVLDPDAELSAALHAVAPDRIQVLEPRRVVINLMSWERSLAPALEVGQWMSAATSILKRTLDLVPGNPARFLLDVSGRVVDPVVREGTLLVLHVTAFVLLLASRHLPFPEGWKPDCKEHRAIFQDLTERAQPRTGEPPPNILALVSWVLGALPGSAPARIAESALAAIGPPARQGQELARGLRHGADPLSAGGDHARAVLAVAQAIVAPFAAPATSTSMYFGCELGFEPKDALDLRALVSSADRRFLVVDRVHDGADALVAAAVKQLFAEALLGRTYGSAGELPLCGLVARNFERHATGMDRTILERARSAGGFAVLASRSVSAIELALANVPGGEGIFPHLWSAAGTKLLLRSTDPRTQHFARVLAPRRPGLPHVLEARPLAGLGPDECYLTAPDGRFERRRLALWTQAEPEPAEPGASSRVLSFPPSPHLDFRGELP